jgi:hypothetical protein
VTSVDLNGVEVSSICGELCIPAASFDASLREFLSSSGLTSVHSVFESTINIIWHNKVMGIHPRETYFPGCIRLASDGWRLLKKRCQRIQPGDRVRIDNGLVRLCSAAGIENVTVDVTNANLDSFLYPDITPYALDCLRNNLSRLALLNFYPLAELCRSLLYGSEYHADYPAAPFAMSGKNRIQQMLQALRNRDKTALLMASESLVGFGSGLTPAGDDILTGFLAVTAILKTGWIDDSFSEQLIQTAFTRTHPIAFTYMKLASQRNISSLLLDVIEAACKDSSRTFMDNLLRLISWGSSSGFDTAVGTILGLSAVVLHDNHQ